MIFVWLSLAREVSSKVLRLKCNKDGAGAGERETLLKVWFCDANRRGQMRNMK